MLQGRKAVEQFGQLELLKEFNQTMPPNRSLLVQAPQPTLVTPPSSILTPPPSRNSPVALDNFAFNIQQLTLMSQQQQQQPTQPQPKHQHKQPKHFHQSHQNQPHCQPLHINLSSLNVPTMNSPSMPPSSSLSSSQLPRLREFNPVVGAGRPHGVAPHMMSRHFSSATPGTSTAMPTNNNTYNLPSISNGHMIVKTKTHLGPSSSNNNTNNNCISLNNCANNNNNNQRRDGCPFCKRNNESDVVVMSHQLRDDQGRITCPQLRKHICETCGATGDYAHTRSYCPRMRQKAIIGGGAPANMSCINFGKFNAAGKERNRR